mgnify:CR=1 FL=1
MLFRSVLGCRPVRAHEHGACAVGVHRRDPRNRPRHHAADDQSIGGIGVETLAVDKDEKAKVLETLNTLHAEAIQGLD